MGAKFKIMNWGYKILIIYSAFVLGIVFMVYKATQQNSDLVTTDYYAKELVYQDRIDEAKRTSLLSAPVSIVEKNRQLEIVFPKEFADKKVTGSVKIYFPANERRDAEKKFETRGSMVEMPIPEQNKGFHYVQISWVADGLNYYHEQKINL